MGVLTRMPDADDADGGGAADAQMKAQPQMTRMNARPQMTRMNAQPQMRR